MGNIVKSVEHDYATVSNEFYALLGRYPFVRHACIGKSTMGRQIHALQIGRRKEYVLFAAAFHGTERITSAVALRFAQQVCDAVVKGGTIADIPIRRALKERGIIIVPMVNPDGCDIAIHGEKACLSGAARIKRLCGGHFEKWNANGRGVDINHNFDAGWQQARLSEQEAGVFGPGPTRYGGTRPESEPETAALVKLCRKMNIAQVMALHTQGEEIYWRYGENTPDRSERMARILAASSGYRMADPDPVASRAGFKDWFIERFGRPGFTVELGKGVNPLPCETLEDIYPAARELMALTVIM